MVRKSIMGLIVAGVPAWQAHDRFLGHSRDHQIA